MPLPPARVDELRAKLRALGYLEAGVDRFVLGPARDTRGVSAIALGSSARIGVLAATLLGPAAAIGIALRVPGLITGPRDAFVIALYLGALFGLAATSLAFVATAAAGLLVRRVTPGGGIARRIRHIIAGSGFAVSVASIVYLTLWWRAAHVSSVWNAPIRTALALTVAVAISALLGHSVRITALAVVARSGAGLVLEPRRAAGTWRSLGVAALGAFLGAAILLVSTTGSRRNAPAPASAVPPFRVTPTGLRLVVVAIDGFDAGLYARLAADARVPNLRVLLGGAVVRLSAPSRDEPVRVWTTVATGQPAEVHGLEALEVRRVAGVQGRVAGGRSPLAATVAAATDLVRLTSPAVASGAERLTKTFWEVAAEKGFRVAVVNWWATWPATGIEGIVITDRAPLRLDRGGALNAEIAPASLYDALRSDWQSMRTAARTRAEDAFPGGGEIAGVLRRSAELDAIQTAFVRHPAVGSPDLLTLYLPGLDIAQHTLLGESGPSTLAPSDLSARLDGVGGYYEFLDRLISELLRTEEAGVAAVLVTHPGRVGTGDSFMAVRGDRMRTRATARGTLTDVTPTILFLLGMPISRELPGQARVDLVAPEFLARFPIRLVPTYGARTSPPAQGDSGLDQEMIERLRSLGYVR